jgi:guanine deaminase
MTEQTFMQRAVALSLEKMRANSGGPFGAVIVRNGTIISEGWNEVTSRNDPTAHSEIVAIRRACTVHGTFNLLDCDIYTSCEPCPMCLGAIYWARLRRYASKFSRSNFKGPVGSRLRKAVEGISCLSSMGARFRKW